MSESTEIVQEGKTTLQEVKTVVPLNLSSKQDVGN